MFAKMKQLINSRNEDFTFYVQCNCGNEIIQFYYYKETSIDPTIIGIKYFGYLKDKKDSRCANFNFSVETLDEFIEATYKALNINIIHGYIPDDNNKKEEFLIFDKDRDNFYRLYKVRDKLHLKQNKYIWDICLRRDEVSLIYEKLIEMREVIRNDQRTNY